MNAHTDAAPFYSPWTVQHHEHPPLCAARIPHSSAPTSSPDLTDTPVTKLLPVTGGQFTGEK